MDNQFESELKKLFSDFIGSLGISEDIYEKAQEKETKKTAEDERKENTDTVLRTSPNSCVKHDSFIKFDSLDFTALYPRGSKAYFGKLSIAYVPSEKATDRRSLVKYLTSYRNCKQSHEEAANAILSDLIRELSPKYVEVFGEFESNKNIYTNYGKESTKWASMAWERLSHYYAK